MDVKKLISEIALEEKASLVQEVIFGIQKQLKD